MVKYWLDAGHGGADPGAIGNGLHEADVNLKIMQYAKAALEQYEGAVVGITRNANVTVELGKRDDLADNWGADYFVSIHINAGGGEGFESFIYNGSVSAETIKLQNTLHAEVFAAIKKFKADVRDRGKARANFSVLRETNAPAVLLENLFIDTAADAAILKNEAALKAIGQAIASGLAKMKGLKLKAAAAPAAPAATKPADPTGKLYRVQVGAFANKAGAEKLVKDLATKGFAGFIKYE